MRVFGIPDFAAASRATGSNGAHVNKTLEPEDLS